MRRLLALFGRVGSRGLALSRKQSFRVAFGVLLVALAVWAVLVEWDEVSEAVSRLSPGWLALAFLATLVNVGFAGMSWWTVLADLGSRLPLAVAARIFFVGQLGKYLPGSVWPVVMQTELGRDHQVPRTRTATATMITLLLAVTSALLVVLVALPMAPTAVPDGFNWAVALVVPLLLVLHPSVLGRLVRAVMRFLGREPMERVTSGRGTIAATLWACGSWIGAGLQVLCLAIPLGAPADLLTAVLLIGGYALAWAVGFVIVIAPAGAGARELALAAVLAPILDTGSALVVVLLSRVLFSLADLGAAGLGIFVARIHGATTRQPV